VNNNIARGSFGGINLAGSSFNTLTGNNIAENTDGIYPADSSNNTVTNNNITSNGRGVFLVDSSDNRFYHNGFVDNSYQVHIMKSAYANIWDDGYPSGGNYWSDHVCIGNPSDGSQPYVLDDNNIDQYPFQNLNGWLHHLAVDVNGDGKVDIQDLGIAASAFGSYPEHPRWYPNADVNGDDKTDLKDIALIAKHFGETC